MSKVTEAMRGHHRELARILNEQVSALEENSSQADPQALVEFLKTDLLPHAQGEEAALYPVVDDLVRDHARPTATMSIDHEYVSNYIKQIEETTRSLAETKNGNRDALVKRLILLGRQLEGLFQVHLDKEERVYLPLFEKYLSAEEQQRVLNGMHEDHSQELAGESKTIDVRTIPPMQRHPLIFETYESLQPGEAFILVNDHDPKPLYYQFKFERDGEFNWEYLEQGPETWRVQVEKLK